MQISPYKSFHRLFNATFASLALFTFNTDAPAWGPDGHTAIGVLAVSQLDPASRDELESVTGPLNEQVMMEACNWPDDIRGTKDWEWTAPRHYINIPRGKTGYSESRDCPDRICNTEAIKISAAELANRQSGKNDRWQAFAWLCHLVGDLHQPLHAGFASDRGGNSQDVIYKGEEMNLHRFWDHQLMESYAGNSRNLVQILRGLPTSISTSDWSPESVNDWTSESHILAEQKAYPPSIHIDDVFAQQSWEIAQQQLTTAASRLALIINSELKLRNQEVRDPAPP